MVEARPDRNATLALSTKVEEDFVSPLTAVRGALEILRDYPDLAETERQQFVDTALRACARLERGVAHLAEIVYDAGEQALPGDEGTTDAEPSADLSNAGPVPVRFDASLGVADISLAGRRFTRSAEVNAFYDVIDERVEASGRKWYFLVDYADCSIWPEAWVAFAHRAKKVNATYALGTVRYRVPDGPDDAPMDPDMCASREAALERIAAMRRSQPAD